MSAGTLAQVGIARITTEPLDLAAHIAAVSGPSTGAVATFLGTVRDHDPGAAGEVTLLEYSAHPDAERILGEIAAACGEGVECTVAVSHRIGELQIGDAAVVVAVGSPHRAEAFEVCRAVIERIKTELPVWKRQHDASGTASWVGL
ncbi:molybdenum cofactor biosynthesis protein MoaE [Microbacterium sediminicola]|uniref:Molybdenum cofactor biosynthesis protein MoaE n=1 Tax=Microbacterium sediminicola TaxID=415210 RepID=A0ABP4TG72_9MICO